ncbi:hypothetical protein J1605_018197 [Eschrichtius robustus]|uniref:Trafficking protein particle complex subunit 6B n=1 Tax=Eschrichtius robustus TaxID=9764 RepID=A0AB34HXF7_ESCRO|nr:hypothetical protein J1605_018197 [Eschrichtius robustus]
MWDLPRPGLEPPKPGAWKNKQEMADEALFLLLHNEMVSGVYKSAEQGEVENGRCITKLENMGFRVGQGLIERKSTVLLLVDLFRFTKDTARFKDELDIMKFICKDFWTAVFKKQIDNLRTNHQSIDYIDFGCFFVFGTGHLRTSGQQISPAYSNVCRKTVFRTCIKVFPKGIGVDDWISHTNIHGTISSQWVGVSAHLVYHLSPPLPSDDHERTSMEMKAIILRKAGYTDRKYLNCASELTNPGIASPLDFLLFLEAGKSKIKAPVDLVSGEGLLLGSQTDVF